MATRLDSGRPLADLLPDDRQYLRPSEIGGGAALLKHLVCGESPSAGKWSDGLQPEALRSAALLVAELDRRPDERLEPQTDAERLDGRMRVFSGLDGFGRRPARR